jgi:cobalt-zinc-cadmium efflux system membrane fusion protein
MNSENNPQIEKRKEGAGPLTWVRQRAALAVLLVVLLTGALLFLTGRLQFNRNVKEETGPPERAEEGEQVASSPNRVQGGKVVLEEDAFKLSGIRTAAVSRGSVPVLFQAPGEVQLAEDRIAHVTPQVPGVVRAVYKGVGDHVQRGAPLCLIESVDLGDAMASYVTARAEADLAEQNFARMKQLFEKGLRTQNELIAVEADRTRARLKLDSASARLRGLGLGADEIQSLANEGAKGVSNQYTLKSPIGGSVLQRNVTTGQSVAASDQVFFVGDLSEIWVQAVAQEQDLPGIRTGAPAVIRIPNLPDTVFRGRVTYIGEQVDEKTRTVPLRVLATNRSSRGASGKDFVLRPGLFTNIEIETARRKDALVISFAAVQSEGSESFVFVQAGNTTGNPKRTVTFERKSVELGARYGQMVEIRSGLQPGDVIANENAYLLKGELEKSKLQD